jgi:opacity protein-like surface antigen
MKKALLTGITFAALAAGGPVAAADLAAPVYKGPVVAAYDWSGVYIGENVGGAWGSSDFNDSSVSSVVDPFVFVLALGFFPPSQGMSPVSTTVNSRSWTGGSKVVGITKPEDSCLVPSSSGTGPG